MVTAPFLAPSRHVGDGSANHSGPPFRRARRPDRTPARRRPELSGITTNEMSRSVAEAAQGSGQIAENITGVSTAAGSTTQALTQTRVAVDELSHMAADLRTTVGTFTY